MVPDEGIGTTLVDYKLFEPEPKRRPRMAAVAVAALTLFGLESQRWLGWAGVVRGIPFDGWATLPTTTPAADRTLTTSDGTAFALGLNPGFAAVTVLPGKTTGASCGSRCRSASAKCSSN